MSRFFIFERTTGDERLGEFYREQQKNPGQYFEVQDGYRLTGILDKTARYLFVPEGITEIGAFAGCVSLVDTVVPAETANIEGTAFESVEHVWYSGHLKDAPWGAWNMN